MEESGPGNDDVELLEPEAGTAASVGSALSPSSGQKANPVRFAHQSASRHISLHISDPSARHISLHPDSVFRLADALLEHAPIPARCTPAVPAEPRAIHRHI